MQMALQEAERVGGCLRHRIHGLCALVSADGNLISLGAHEKAGQPHAEVEAVHSAIIKLGGHVPERYTDEWWSVALQLRSDRICDAEPCHHSGKTPPCDHHP